MNFFPLLKRFNKLSFAIFLLLLIALSSSLGSIIEQDQSTTFYETNYPKDNGFFNYEIIFLLQLNSIYKSWWFLLLLLLLAISLVSCTITTQFPIISNSKFFYFKEKANIQRLPFFFKVKNFYFFKEKIIQKLQKKQYLLYQKKKSLYSYKGLLGRISPIFVHISLLLILGASFLGAFLNSKTEQISPKGEISHLQLGKIKSSLRCNDFWIQYNEKKITQFYSNLSLVNNYGNEIFTKTLSVNKPIKFQGLDIYQSDWNIPGIRLSLDNGKNFQYPLFFTNTTPKIWITWINFQEKNYTLIFQRAFSSFFIYDEYGNFLNKNSLTTDFFRHFSFLEFVYSTGLFLKYNTTIPVIYLGFLILLLTTIFSYFPYNQLWILANATNIWIGGISNRGKIGFEIELENLVRKFLFSKTDSSFRLLNSVEGKKKKR